MATFRKTGKKGQEKWSVVFDLPGHSPRKQKKLSGFKTKNEANLSHIAFVANYKIPDIEQPFDGESFESIYQSYIKYVKYSVKETSYLSIEAAFRHHILPYFKAIELLSIMPQTITDWLMWLDNRTNESKKPLKQLSYKSKIKIKGFLSRFFLFCIDNEKLSINPCNKALKIKKTEIKKEMLVWSQSDFIKFIGAVDILLYKALFSFLYLSGCRRGEALALTWNDLQGNAVRINKSLSFQSIEGGYRITTPKNQYSIRNVVLPENLVEILINLKETQIQKELFDENNFIFGGTRALPQNNIRRKLAYYCELAKVKLIRIHDFRHSHASFLISKGHDIVTIARRLGHADIEMTLNQYGHLMPNKQTELMCGLNIKLS